MQHFKNFSLSTNSEIRMSDATIGHITKDCNGGAVLLLKFPINLQLLNGLVLRHVFTPQKIVSSSKLAGRQEWFFFLGRLHSIPRW